MRALAAAVALALAVTGSQALAQQARSLPSASSRPRSRATRTTRSCTSRWGSPTGTGTTTRARSKPSSARSRWDPASPRRTTGSAWRFRKRPISPAPSPNSSRPSSSIPKYGRAYTNLGAALAKSGDFTGAVTVFRKALALEPDSLAAHLNLGRALRETGDLDGALEHLKVVAAADATTATVHYEIGQVLRQNGDLAGAVASFERALELEPELREGYYGLGLALKAQSAALQKTRPAAPPSPANDLYSNARAAMERGDVPAARDQLVEALRVDDRNADAHNLLGFILGQQGNLPEALAHLERATALQPFSADAHYNLGVALWYNAAKDRALTELKQSAVLDPACGACYAFLGTVLREGGNLPMAQASLQRAIAVLAPTAAVYVDLGITYLRADALDRALGQFEAGLNLPPSLPAPDWDAAIDGLRRAIAAHPDQAEAHNVLGLMLGRKGADSAEVAAEIREAIRLRPDYAEAQNNLGLVLLQAGDDAGAIAAFREAVRISPEYADAHDNLGAALTPTDAAEAVRELETAVRLAPASVKALYNLAMAYGVSPAPGPAKQIEYLRKVIELEPAFARARLALGKALLQDGKPADAVEQLQEATKLEPDNGESHYQLGLALARAGRRDEATPELPEGPRPHRRERSQPERQPGSDGRTRRARERRPAAGRGEVPAGDQARARLRRSAGPARHGPRKAGQLPGRPDGVPQGARAEPVGADRAAGARPADEGLDQRGGRFADRELRGGNQAGQVQGRRAVAGPVRHGSPDIVVGLVCAGLQPVRAAEDRRLDPLPGEVARARHHQRRGAQDPGPQPDDHRPIRRGGSGVPAGSPLQAGFGGASLQSREAAFHPGQLGARAQAVRGGPQDRPVCTSRRWTRWGSPWKRWATTRRRLPPTRRP